MSDREADQADRRPSSFDAERRLDVLETLLRRQMDLWAQDQSAHAATLAEEMQALVSTLAEEGVRETDAFRHRRARLEKLYHDFALVLTATRDDVRRQIVQSRQGRKAIAAYRRSTTCR